MTHPYVELADYCFWRRAISSIPAADIDPVVSAKFRVSRTDRVVTAGSCFAQHISRYLVASGFNFHITEPLASFIEPHLAVGYNYGIFSARYGNIYTARQFIQMLRRAYGLFVPLDEAWLTQDGRAFDPYRPRIQPDGFSSPHELQADRKQHLASVRRMVEEADVLIFTLGLTEAWENAEDGAVYPLCPGTAAGTFDERRHRFVNFRMSQILDDMIAAFDFVRDRNHGIRFILTVSPVPLVATAENRHVLVSTTYSKSLLRTVCGELEERFDDVAYFPAYEIVTGNFNRGAYFQADLREIAESGIEHVMRLFMRHYWDEGGASALTGDARSIAHEVADAAHALATIVCDEEALEN